MDACRPWSSSLPRLIGMLHVPPLPGSPGFSGEFDALCDGVVNDATTLVEAGFRGLMLENFGDAPFFPGRVPIETVTHLTALGQIVRSRVGVELGVNVLRNDGCSAMAVASAIGASFVRVNVLCCARVTDQGVIQGIAHDLLRLRKSLDAESVQILADVDVKHSAPLADRPIEDEVEDMLGRGGADAIIVSGAGTGREVDTDQLLTVMATAVDAPVFVGSGVSEQNVHSALKCGAGIIVGSAIKQDGVVTNPVDGQLAGRLITACESGLL